MSGPSVGTGCAVCEHPQASQINAALQSGKLSNRKIALQFQVGKDSVNRHVYKRHPGYAPPGAPGQVPEDGDTELTRLKLIRTQLEEDMAARARPETSRELRQVNQRISELEGTDRPKSVTVEDVRGLPEQVARWFQALEPYPEARQAMLAATDPALLGAAGVS